MSGARDLPADLIERAAREAVRQAIYALPGPNLEGIARMSPEKQEGYLLAIEEAAQVADSALDVADHWPTPTAHRDCPSGWYPFGIHAGWDEVPPLEFSDDTDEAGMPLWERPSGVLRDAAHVETEARAKAGEDIARAIDAADDDGNYDLERGLNRAARIARDTTAGTT